MKAQLGREPTIEELAVAIKTTPEKIHRWQSHRREVCSLNRLIDYIVDTSEAAPIDILYQQQLQNDLDDLMDCLTDRERRVLGLRYKQELTLEDAGGIMGVTRERIRQIEKEALDKLRAPERIEPLRKHHR